MTSPYGKNIHIIGVAGTEGAALLRYLRSSFPSATITAHDYSKEDQFLRNFVEAHIGRGKKEALELGKEILDLEGVHFQFQGEYLKGIEEADSIFVPQSWYLYSQNEALKLHQEKFRSITRLYFDLFPGKIIGITGSNGKTTTSTMIAEIMQRAFPSTLYSGNDRRAAQVLDRMEPASEDDWLVLEISNRQLMIDLGKSPDIGIITNITPNHLNEYKNFEEYAQVKASLLQHQTLEQWSVLNADDPVSERLIEVDGGETLPFSVDKVLPRGVFVQFDHFVIKHAEREERLMPTSDFPLIGKHNLSNALAAVAAAYLAGVSPELIAQTLRSLKPVPQRLELVETVGGVEYYNDSASTVPESTLAALNGLRKSEGDVLLIMGGNSKGSDYSTLAQVLSEKSIKILLLNSPVAEEVKALLQEASGRIDQVDTLQEAVSKAHELAKSGDKILFSPAAEYFSYFRGKMKGYKNFRDMVSRLN